MNKRLSVVVIDSEGGNLASAARALICAAELLGCSVSVVVTNEVSIVRKADRIVLPGQGAFTSCMRGLTSVRGLQETLEETVMSGTPFLGICVGMQLMAQRGLEHGITKGFGWIEGDIVSMACERETMQMGSSANHIQTPSKEVFRESASKVSGLRLPQMGWNELNLHKPDHPLVQGLGKSPHGYFVHSYALRNTSSDVLVATTEYGGEVPAIVCRGNVAGTQFHVEKSQKVGLKILANFLSWCPQKSLKESLIDKH